MKLSAQSRKIITLLFTTYNRPLLVAVAVLIIAIGYFTLLAPQFNSVRQVGIQAYHQATEQFQARQNYYQKVTAMLERFRTVPDEQIIISRRMIPEQPEINKLFLILEAVARESNMTLESVAVSRSATPTAATPAANQPSSTTVSPSPSVIVDGADSQVKSLDVNFTVSGPFDYASYKKILRNLEKSLRLFDVASIQYSTPHNQDNGGNTESKRIFAFDLKAYYYENTTQK